MSLSVPKFYSQAPQCSGGHGNMNRRQVEDQSSADFRRWYYSCDECPKAVLFDDWEGIREANPVCGCGEVSRLANDLEGICSFRCARQRCSFVRSLEGTWCG